jgi:hypothetical protein
VSAIDATASPRFIWENDSYGLNGWESYDFHLPAAKFAAADANGPLDCTPDGDEELNQRWEMTAVRNGAPTYTRGAIIMKGWDGGKGATDCEPNSWNDGAVGRQWGNYFSISFGPGYQW